MKNIIKVISFIILISGFEHADIVEKLTSLNNLYKEGAINKEEYTKAKSILLQNKDKEECWWQLILTSPFASILSLQLRSEIFTSVDGRSIVLPIRIGGCGLIFRERFQCQSFFLSFLCV